MAKLKTSKTYILEFDKDEKIALENLLNKLSDEFYDELDIPNEDREILFNISDLLNLS